MGKFIDLTGRQFGRLTVLGRAENKGVRAAWSCRCECGTEREVLGRSLRIGVTVSCGCYHREAVTRHGHTVGEVHLSTPTYRSWRSMYTRCTNPAGNSWHYYGGRGITISPRWLGTDGFSNFLADLGERPAGTTLDRIDVNGNYEPGNCRWATPYEQIHNRRKPSRVSA